ncbi:hypothetical protein [Streptomyces sp. NRRL S-350]|uniref:hypothetical protein n=1 Tax=Streptomyces sp. NRRL S-350 TaxID=1463902 RepID=UPI0004C0D883|nr:hypothetical protein [Streptomyces sp. NRRL S-350]
MTDTSPPPMSAADHDAVAAERRSQAAAFNALADQVCVDPELRQTLAAVGAQHLASGPVTAATLRGAARAATDNALVHEATAECRRRSADRSPCRCGHRDNQHAFHLTDASTIPCRSCACQDYRPLTRPAPTLGAVPDEALVALPPEYTHHDV